MTSSRRSLFVVYWRSHHSEDSLAPRSDSITTPQTITVRRHSIGSCEAISHKTYPICPCPKDQPQQRRSVFADNVDSTCEETASLSESSTASSISCDSITTLADKFAPNRRSTAPGSSCIRTSRFSQSERNTACTPKSLKVSFDDHVEVVSFTPPQERWTPGGWKEFFSW